MTRIRTAYKIGYYENIKASYLDEDNDLIKFSKDEEIKNALKFHKNPFVLKIFVTL